MRQEIQAIFRRTMNKAASAGCIALGGAPVFVLLNEMFLPDMPWSWIFWILPTWVLAWVMGLPKGRYRIYSGCLGTLFLALLFAVRWSAGGIFFLLPVANLYWFILRVAGKPPFQEWRMGGLLACGALHLAGLIAASHIGLAEALPALRVLIGLYIPVFLLLMNRGFLLRESWAREGQTPQRHLLMGNQKLTMGLAIAVLILANLKALGKALSAAMGWVARLIGVVIHFVMSLIQGQPMPGEGAGGPMGMPPVEPAGETSPFWAILEKIFMIIGCIAAVVGIALLLWKLFRLARRALGGVLSRMRAMMASLGQDVREETESLFDWRQWRVQAGKRLDRARKRLRRPPKWADMDNRGRVRWAYGRLARRIGNDSESATARETLSGFPEGASLADIYDRARYSEETIEDGDALAIGAAARREE